MCVSFAAFEGGHKGNKFKKWFDINKLFDIKSMLIKSQEKYISKSIDNANIERVNEIKFLGDL